MIRFEKAKAADAKELAMVSRRAFDDDVNYGAPGPGGPPGYKSDRWQGKMMKMGKYYKIVDELRIIGGFIAFDMGEGRYELGRIFIDPGGQNQGIGARAFDFIREEFPQVERWTLGTPEWNGRTRHFYAKMGFEEVGKEEPDGILFEKRMPAAESS